MHGDRATLLSLPGQVLLQQIRRKAIPRVLEERV